MTLVKFLAAGMVAALSMLFAPSSARAQISADAETILRAMSDYLGSLQQFSVAYDVDTEIITGEGQKLQYSAGGTILVRRPDGIRVTREGGFASTETLFDGNTLTLFGRKANAYFQLPFEGTIDQAVQEFRIATGMDAPAADLLAANPFDTLVEGVLNGEFVATGQVDGVPCYHIAFREADVDWQLWVSTDEQHPVPMKYVITTKWTTGAPQHSVRLRDWNFAPAIAADAFAFVAPKDAVKLETLAINETGEAVLGGE